MGSMCAVVFSRASIVKSVLKCIALILCQARVSNRANTETVPMASVHGRRSVYRRE